MMTFYKDPLKDVLETFFEREISKDRSVKFLEKDEKYLIYLKVPGLTKDDISISLKDDLLTIKYEKEKNENDEFSFTNSFKKSYFIPDDISEEDIRANVKNGILEIILPKSKEKNKEKIISLE
jgi:HSP20 family protein